MKSVIRHEPGDPQAELVRRYCGEAEDVIANARTPEEAAEAGSEYCRKLRADCSSGLIVHATEEYIASLVKARFHDKNKAHNQH